MSPSGEPSIALRPMTLADIPAGLRLCRASGWNQIARDWEHFLTENPAGARVLEKEGAVVGTVTTLRYGLFGWIAMVLVDPAERRQGFGSRLLSTGLDLLADMPSVRLDATPAGEPLYRARGFAELERLARMIAVAPQMEPGRSSPGLRPMTAGDLAPVAGWDAEAFGAGRRAMIEWLFRGAPEYAWIAMRSGRIAGYTLGRHGFHFEQLGPIVAEDLEVALELANACLSRHAGRRFAIDAPRHTPGWVQWLEGLGFQAQRPLTRMGRGAGPSGRPGRVLAIVGPEFG